MELIFWICSILLALGAVSAFAIPAPNRPWIYAGSGILVVIDLIILGLKLIGPPK